MADSPVTPLTDAPGTYEGPTGPIGIVDPEPYAADPDGFIADLSKLNADNLAELASDNPAMAPAAIAAGYVAVSAAAQKYADDFQNGEKDPFKVLADSTAIVSAAFLVAADAVNLVPDGKVLSKILSGTATALGDISDASAKAADAGATAEIEQAVTPALDALQAFGTQAGNTVASGIGSLYGILDNTSDQIISEAASGTPPSPAAGTGSLGSEPTDLFVPVAGIYADEGGTSQASEDTFTDTSATFTTDGGPLVSATATDPAAAPDTGTVDAEFTDGTSVLTAYNGDGSSTATAYSGPNGTGAVTGIDQENSDGTSQITTFDASGNAVTVDYSGPAGTGTAGGATLTAGTSPGSQTVLTIGAVTAAFAPARAGDAAQVAETSLAVQGGYALGANDSLITTYLFDAGLVGTGPFYSGTYQPGSTGAAYIQETPATGITGAFSGIPVPLTLITPNGNVTLDMLASGNVYAPATAVLSTNELDFGDLHVGDTATLGLTVTDTTAGALQDSLNVGTVALSAANPYFSISQDGTADGIVSGGTATINVTYHAMQAGYGQASAPRH